MNLLYRNCIFQFQFRNCNKLSLSSVHCVHIDYSSDVFILLFVSLHFRYLKLLSLVICSVFIFLCNDYKDQSLKRTFSFCRKTISLCYSGRLRNFVEILIRWGVSWSQYLSSTIYIMNLNEHTRWMIPCVKQVWDWQGHCRAAVGSEPWKRVRSLVSILFSSFPISCLPVVLTTETLESIFWRVYDTPICFMY